MENDIIEDSFEEDDDCPVCRMMEEELGLIDGVPFDALTRGGIALPHPDTLNDAEIAQKVWEVIEGLAAMRIFLHQTDHLSDRELYAALWRDILRDSIWYSPDDPFSATHIDLLGGGSDEDHETWLRYYADDAEREQWKRELADEVIPPHVDPPYRRDAMLPNRFDALGKMPS